MGFGMNVAYAPRSAATCLTADAERHHVVGHRERVGVAEVDLVLARPELVEAVLDRDAHRLERDDRLTPQLAHHVELGEVEEAGVVERLGCLVPTRR